MSLVITQGYGASGSGTPPSLISVTATAGQVTIVFNSPVTLTGNSLLVGNWSIVANDDSSVVPITSVGLVGGSVVLATGETGSTRTYTLAIPAGILGLTTQGFFLPTTTTFTGAGATPTFFSAKPLSSVSLEVVFSEAVIASDALNTANYSVNNGLTISGASQVNASTFRLTTSQMVSGLSYLLTAANIRDAAGNLM